MQVVKEFPFKNIKKTLYFYVEQCYLWAVLLNKLGFWNFTVLLYNPKLLDKLSTLWGTFYLDNSWCWACCWYFNLVSFHPFHLFPVYNKRWPVSNCYSCQLWPVNRVIWWYIVRIVVLMPFKKSARSRDTET